MLELVGARLGERVVDLGGRVGSAAELAELLRRNQMPQVTPAAYVLPLGLQGGKAGAGAGEYRQDVTEVVGVVLAVRVAGDATGSKAVDIVTPIRDSAIRAIVGWGPDEAIGVFRVSRGELLSMTNGMLLYQIDFALDDQLRIFE